MALRHARMGRLSDKHEAMDAPVGRKVAPVKRTSKPKAVKESSIMKMAPKTEK